MLTITNLKVSSDLLKTDHYADDLTIIEHIEHVLNKGTKTLRQIEEESSRHPYTILDTALNYYIFFGKIRVVEYLIENQKANLLLQDNNGNTVMHCLANLSFHIENEEKLQCYQLMTDYLLSKYDLLLKNNADNTMIDIFKTSSIKQSKSYYGNAILNKNYTFYLNSIFEKWYLENLVPNQDDDEQGKTSSSGSRKI